MSEANIVTVDKEEVQRKENTKKTFYVILLTILAILYLVPIVLIFINSFKDKTFISRDTFALPNEKTFVGLDNYKEALTHYGFLESIGWTFVITILSVALILLCTSMCGWFITRVDRTWTKVIYYSFAVSMVVPFQMVMFTLSFTADRLKLNTPWLIPLVYLGFGAGLAVFMFTGAVKTIPKEIEEAAMIDGASPLQLFFQVVVPILKPEFITIGILETMWIWNDFLLPYLVLDINKYQTISITVQYMKGSYGRVDMGAIMAALVMAVIPVIIFYAFAQKYIVAGIIKGAVKG